MISLAQNWEDGLDFWQREMTCGACSIVELSNYSLSGFEGRHCHGYPATGSCGEKPGRLPNARSQKSRWLRKPREMWYDVFLHIYIRTVA